MAPGVNLRGRRNLNSIGPWLGQLAQAPDVVFSDAHVGVGLIQALNPATQALTFRCTNRDLIALTCA